MLGGGSRVHGRLNTVFRLNIQITIFFFSGELELKTSLEQNRDLS